MTTMEDSPIIYSKVYNALWIIQSDTRNFQLEMPQTPKIGHGHVTFGSTKMAPSTATSVSRMPRIKRAMRCVSFPTSTVHHNASQCGISEQFAISCNMWLCFQTWSEQSMQQASNTNAKNSAIRSAKLVWTDAQALVSALCAQRTDSHLNACWLTPANDLQAWKSRSRGWAGNCIKCKQCHLYFTVNDLF